MSSVSVSAFLLELLEDLFFTLELLEDLELLFAFLLELLDDLELLFAFSLELLERSVSSPESLAELPESSPQETNKNERSNRIRALFFMIYSFLRFCLLLNLLKYSR